MSVSFESHHFDLGRLLDIQRLWLQNEHEVVETFYYRIASCLPHIKESLFLGLENLIHHITSWKFPEELLSYMQNLLGRDGEPLFAIGFMGYIRKLEYSLDIDSCKEGTFFSQKTPVLRVRGKQIACLLVEPLYQIYLHESIFYGSKIYAVVKQTFPSPLVIQSRFSSHLIRASYIAGAAAFTNPNNDSLAAVPVCHFSGDEYIEWRDLIQPEVLETINPDNILGVIVREQDIEKSPYIREFLDQHQLAHVRLIGMGNFNEVEIERLTNQKVPIAVWVITNAEHALSSSSWQREITRSVRDEDHQNLIPVLRNGERVSPFSTIDQIRSQVCSSMSTSFCFEV